MALALLIKRFQRTKWCLLTTDMISAAFVTWFIHNWNMNGCHEIICGLYGMDNDGIYDELIIYLKMCIHYLLFQFAKASADLNCFFRLGLLSWSWCSYFRLLLFTSVIHNPPYDKCLHCSSCLLFLSIYVSTHCWIVQIFPRVWKIPHCLFCMYVYLAWIKDFFEHNELKIIHWRTHGNFFSF